MTILQAIEVFHLLFLQQLGSRVSKDLWVLKGGCNLRFFLRSIRYSEDIDFDVQKIALETLRKNVGTILDSPTFATILRSQGLAITRWSAPKQTDTVQRWKLRLQVLATEEEAPTKLEFSRRRIEEGVAFEPVNSQLLHEYGLSPMLANHYTKGAALLQKISALARRSETQARDVFDLKLLFDSGATAPSTQEKLKQDLALACERALSVSFDDFKAQVVAYLPAQWQEYYRDPAAWSQLQESVVDALGGEVP